MTPRACEQTTSWACLIIILIVASALCGMLSYGLLYPTVASRPIGEHHDEHLHGKPELAVYPEPIIMVKGILGAILSIIFGLIAIIIVLAFTISAISLGCGNINGNFSASMLKKVPTLTYRTGDDYDTCAICLEEWTDGEQVRRLPCYHVYHPNCIDQWFTEHKWICPSCRGPVPLKITCRCCRSPVIELCKETDIC